MYFPPRSVEVLVLNYRRSIALQLLFVAAATVPQLFASAPPTSSPSASQMPVAYWGELTLPVPLYTPEGVQLEPGKFGIQIRSEKERRVLLFLHGDHVVATVTGTPVESQPSSGKLPDVPVIGTVYLYPPDVPREPKEEKPTVTFTQHLRSRPWKAALRVYRYADPANAAVDFIFTEELKPGERLQNEFNLLLSKPR
jgi:hypothetical protein